MGRTMSNSGPESPFQDRGRTNTTVAEWATCAALFLTFLAINHLLVRHKLVVPFDSIDLYAAQQMLVADHAHAGQLVWWNPWCNGGSPDFADPNYGPHSPINVVAAWFEGGTVKSYNWHVLASWFAGGLGMFWLLRHLGSPLWASFVIALAFLFSGLYTGNLEHPSVITAFSGLPWILFFLDKSLLTRRYLPGLQAGVAFGLTGIAGYPLMVCINAMAAAAWVLGRTACIGADREIVAIASTSSVEPSTAKIRSARTWMGALFAIGRRSRAPVVALGLTYAGGLCILGPTYFAFMTEAKGYSERAGVLPREAAVNANALHPRGIATFASPALPYLGFWNPEDRPFVGTDVSSISLYSGAAVFWLAMSALLLRPTDRWRWWLFGLGALCLGFAVGGHLPLRGWLYDWCYPMRYFRHSAFFRGYTVFAICVLAGYAARDIAGFESARLRLLRDSIWPSERRLVVSGVLCFALAEFAYLMVGYCRPNRGPDALLSDLHFHICWSSVLVLGAFVFSAGRKVLVGVLPAALIGLAVFDAFLTQHLSRHTIGHPMTKTWERLDRKHDSNIDLTAAGFERRDTSSIKGFNNWNLYLKEPVFRCYSPLQNRFHQAWHQTPELLDAVIGSDRTWFASHGAAPTVHVSDATFAAFVNRTKELGSPPVVLHRREQMLQRLSAGERGPEDAKDCAAIANAPLAVRIPARCEQYRSNELVFSVDAPEAGVVLFTDRWSQGWQAQVNGIDVAIQGGNYLFRAVPVSKGRNQIAMQYRPIGYPYAPFIGWGFVAAVLSASLVCARRGRRPEAVDAPNNEAVVPARRLAA